MDNTTTTTTTTRTTTDTDNTTTTTRKRKPQYVSEPVTAYTTKNNDDEFYRNFDRKNRRKISETKRIHFSFTFIYALFSAFIILTPLIWSNSIVIWQVGLLGFFHMETGVLIAILLVGNLMKPGRKMGYRSFLIYRSSAWAVIILSIIAAAFTVIYILNLTSILVMQCPEANQTVSISSTDTTEAKQETRGIQDEIMEGIKDVSSSPIKENTIKIDKIGNIVDVTKSSTSDDEYAFSQMLTNYMCTNEKPLMISLLVILPLTVALNVFTIYFYSKIL